MRVPCGMSGSARVVSPFTGTGPSPSGLGSAVSGGCFSGSPAVCSAASGLATATGAAAGSAGLASEAASPSPFSRAMGVFTFTPSVPSGTRMASTTPSSTASTSMVALSVSISAITSPDATVSPALIFHLERVPSSMVGESAGIRTSVKAADLLT